MRWSRCNSGWSRRVSNVQAHFKHMWIITEESYKTMKKLAAIGAISLLASSLLAQGLNTGGQTKDDWEEINFEFNSSILSDGYPSLLRLAELCPLPSRPT